MSGLFTSWTVSLKYVEIMFDDHEDNWRLLSLLDNQLIPTYLMFERKLKLPNIVLKYVLWENGGRGTLFCIISNSKFLKGLCHSALMMTMMLMIMMMMMMIGMSYHAPSPGWGPTV